MYVLKSWEGLISLTSHPYGLTSYLNALALPNMPIRQHVWIAIDGLIGIVNLIEFTFEIPHTLSRYCSLLCSYVVGVQSV